MTHSIIPPSSASIWGKPNGCTGWVVMAQTYPELEESVEAREGTASHEIAAEIIQDATTNTRNRHRPEDWVGITASNNVVFTEEMFEAAKLYADDVIREMRSRSIFGGPNLGIEAPIDAKRIHDLSFGTCDMFMYDRNKGELLIWDYKFGFEIVEAFENWQAINYACGIIDQLEINGHVDQFTTVRIRIAQPRAFHRDGPIREWVVKASDLRGYFNILHNNAHEALGPNAVYRTGSHCKHCPGRHACPAALKAGLSLYETVTKPIPAELSPEAMGVQLALIKRARKALEYLESGFEEQVTSIIRGGAAVPGWMVEQSYGRERWAKPVEEVFALGDMLGHDLRDPKAVTPNQARKLGIDDAVIMAYSEKPKAGVKIVPDNGNKAKHVFGAK